MKKDTICRLCSACCPVEVEVAAGRLVEAERKPFLGAGQGLVCPKLKAAADIVYSPARLKTPLVRKQGAPPGDFREATWDEALSLVAEEFQRVKAEYGAQGVAWLRGMAADWGAPWDYANRLMHAFGSPNAIGNGSVCHVARDMAHVYTYGAMTLPQPKEARCILVWGKNDLNTAPAAGEAILYARRQGAKLIVVDPIRTPLAAMADIWLQIKPGHDGQLAMALINEIITQELYDTAFVERFTLGFEELKAAARRYPAAEVAARTWLDAGQIREAARLYATTRPGCIVEGNGLDMQLEAFQATRAVCCLRALTGNLDQAGGDFIPQAVPARNIQLAERLPPGVEPITCGHPLFNAFHPTWGRHAQSCLVDAMLDEKPYPIRLLVVQSGNPAVTMTDSNRVRKSFAKLEFLVVIDLFQTQTARLAHVVLPACSCFEKTQLNRAFLRNSPVMLQDQVITCVGDSRPDWWITFELGRRLGLEQEFPWKTVEEAIDYQLEPSGITVAMLRRDPAGLRAGEPRYAKFTSGGFATPSGKVEFFSERLQQNGHLAVPYMDGAHEDPISFLGECGSGALIGISGERTNAFTHTQFRHIPVLREREPSGFVDVHSTDARQRGIREGDLLQVETPRGLIRMRARLSDVVHPGSVQIGWGWGEIDPIQGLNNLTDDARRDPVTGTPSNRSFMCRVQRAGGAED